MFNATLDTIVLGRGDVALSFGEGWERV